MITPPALCLCCDAPATVILADWELCEAHAVALTDAGPLCAECGEPLTGEGVCLECAVYDSGPVEAGAKEE